MSRFDQAASAVMATSTRPSRRRGGEDHEADRIGGLNNEQERKSDVGSLPRRAGAEQRAASECRDCSPRHERGIVCERFRGRATMFGASRHAPRHGRSCVRRSRRVCAWPLCRRATPNGCGSHRPPRAPRRRRANVSSPGSVEVRRCASSTGRRRDLSERRASDSLCRPRDRTGLPASARGLRADGRVSASFSVGSSVAVSLLSASWIGAATITPVSRSNCMFGLVGKMRRTVLHPGDLRVRIRLARPIIVRQLLTFALAVKPDQC